MGMVLIGFRVPATEAPALRRDPERVDTLIFGNEEGEGPEPDLDLDKLWHLLQYVITGTAWEAGPGAGQAILGGEEIGQDQGYGRPRLLTPDVVGEVAAALDALDAAVLRARYDRSALTAAEIYPNVWHDPNWGDCDEIVVPFLTALRRFYRSAAYAGEAVVLAMT